MTRFLLLLLALVAAPAPAQLRVFAAASLTEAMQEAGRAYTARTKEPVSFSFASSGTIARQLEGGAPADLFVSADAESMDYAVAKGSIRPGTRRALLGNSLVLVAPMASRAKPVAMIDGRFPLLARLGPNGRLAVGDPAYVPAGRYAEQALTKLGLWRAVQPRLARAENVRAALALVSRGEAPLGIVYATDAALDKGVALAGRFPAASHAPISYPMALTTRAAPTAPRFARFLLSAQARAIFARYGFTPPK
ncbi:molybdate ABC transporter substrate-binding protein [Sphingomonas naphthae]|uniref:Molybdate ABC transporter substrate-binding protein n=1 Tax=Sphingomonas naphthae TaxID=1813468 RepID=A0ABY7TPK4_9SPHN|nr:molybdate ABC transporter substrate-binding protein [Sphingomonas naphthae]WCT74562.1 molybdate ABC transporter substrate-binding protein [Sphingomonas naphthae]